MYIYICICIYIYACMYTYIYMPVCMSLAVEPNEKYKCRFEVYLKWSTRLRLQGDSPTHSLRNRTLIKTCERAALKGEIQTLNPQSLNPNPKTIYPLKPVLPARKCQLAAWEYHFFSEVKQQKPKRTPGQVPATPQIMSPNKGPIRL